MIYLISLIKHRSLFTILIIILVYGTSCTLVGSESGRYVDAGNQLRISLELNKTEIEPNKKLVATYTIRNISRSPVILTTSPPHIADAVTRKDGEIIPLVGTGSGGPGIFGYYYIGTGEKMVTEYVIEAKTSRFDFDTQSIIYTPAEKGAYALNLSANVGLINDQQIRVPEIEKLFWIK